MDRASSTRDVGRLNGLPPTRVMRRIRWVIVISVLALVLAGASVEDGDVVWPRWGFTHTQFSGDHGDPQGVAAARLAIGVRPAMVQNQHIMGWGVGNPNPAPGVHDFADLDNRIGFIRASGGIPVITLCCAPDWMKGGDPGETDWSRLTAAPDREHFADFAALAAVIARRYPDVHHFLVWNELKGFFDEERNRWDAEGYTELYNRVHAALKAVNPAVRVGGPYVTMADPPRGTDRFTSALRGPWGAVDQRALDAFTYWLRHNRGADFVVVDGHTAAGEGSSDGFAALERLSAVNRWIRERTALPIWWAEWYVEPAMSGWSGEQQVAVRAAAMIELASSGVQTALYWNPAPRGPSCATCLWTDTSDPTGGQALPMLSAVLQNFTRWFPAGTRLQYVPVPPQVRVLAQARMLVAVNTVATPVTLGVDGREVTLGPYQTRWIPRQGNVIQQVG